LAEHLENLIMGYPFSEALIDLLKETYTPVEAQVALAIPNHLLPLQVVDVETIIQKSELPKHTVLAALKSLSKKNMIYSSPTKEGGEGYALLQVGYGMPQTFFWGGKQNEHARRMAKLVLKYFTVATTQKVYGGVKTKTYKYSPANLAIDVPIQGVLPHEQMDAIVGSSTKIAVAHCPCRMSAKILGRTDCEHSLEVCLKYDEMAQFVIDKGLAREVSKDETRQILKKCEEEGLVHMVDNAQGEIKHTCNCCGHYCWNVGIIRRRKIPRDVLMDVYFTRVTDPGVCIGCGACAKICPVDAVVINDDLAKVDSNWCIGCGVCAIPCPTEAITIKRRSEKLSPEGFSQLHNRIKNERGLP
jgi:Pyruvate/2-oxoacid:ferredoxin oxidoreductase delta subunit